MDNFFIIILTRHWTFTGFAYIEEQIENIPSHESEKIL